VRVKIPGGAEPWAGIRLDLLVEVGPEGAEREIGQAGRLLESDAGQCLLRLFKGLEPNAAIWAAQEVSLDVPVIEAQGVAAGEQGQSGTDPGAS
jgi:hypothetical protein